MFEGVPNYPDFGRFWDVCDKHKVNIFYTAPTAIRAIAKEGDELVQKRDLSSLKLLGTVGEPINPEAWMWYHRVVGQERCPIVDTWWQTETGGHMITALPGATPLKPGLFARFLRACVRACGCRIGSQAMGGCLACSAAARDVAWHARIGQHAVQHAV